mmetsp:Transcript_30716/g.66419  ORF Transcript_30716/g.66419 Transcript_30716/m.66419 type:complete len:150 (-) Transcript_30716:334-783(-)
MVAVHPSRSTLTNRPSPRRQICGEGRGLHMKKSTGEKNHPTEEGAEGTSPCRPLSENGTRRNPPPNKGRADQAGKVAPAVALSQRPAAANPSSVLAARIITTGSLREAKEGNRVMAGSDRAAAPPRPRSRRPRDLTPTIISSPLRITIM